MENGRGQPTGDPELEDAGFGTWAPDVSTPPMAKVASEEELYLKMDFGDLKEEKRKRQMARILWDNKEVTWEVEPGGPSGSSMRST